MNESSEITLDRVVKSYAAARGTVVALDGVSLTVEAGTSVAVTGHSGCGKSTLLAVIGALEVPDSGQVRVAGQLLADMSASARARIRRADFGFIFQSDNLIPYLTAVENLAQQMALSGRAGGLSRCTEMLQRLGLSEHVHKLPDQLSGGQRQRVAIARALVHHPRYVLADEPTGSLDPASSADVIEFLLAEQKETKATIVVVTHDLSVAERFARRVSLSHGRIVAVTAGDQPALNR